MRAQAAFEMGVATGYMFSLLDVGKDANFERMVTVLWEPSRRIFRIGSRTV